MNEINIFQIVKKQVDAIDLYGLLARGAPQDEFDIESAMIAEHLEKGMNVNSIAKIIADVLNTQFSDDLSADEFISYAEQIEKFLQYT